MDELSNEVHLNDKLRFLLKRIQQKSLNTQRFVFLFHNADKLAFSDTSTLVNLSKLYIGTLPSELRTLIMRKASLTDMQTVAQVDSDIEV